MITTLGVTLILIGCIITIGVSKICDEANTYQLWKGNLEHYLALMDRFALCVIFGGMLVLILEVL